MLCIYKYIVDNLQVQDDVKDTLHKSIKYFLMGQRHRRSIDDWFLLKDFRDKAAAFEKAVEEAIESLATKISAALVDTRITFDATITTSSTGNIMPSVSYRLAHQLPHLIPSDSLMMDFGNVGCTAGMKALNLAKSLNQNFKNILIVCVEVPSTLANMTSEEVDVWQGNCTFGDGSVALWLSSDPQQGQMALELSHIHYRQVALQGLNMIYWQYENYYTFKLGKPDTFEQDVQSHILQALESTESCWRSGQHWAIHPAGIAILLKLSRKLKLSIDLIRPSIASYEKFSNMSSASIMYILKDRAEAAMEGQTINLLSMGAGFNVVYGCVKKVR